MNASIAPDTIDPAEAEHFGRMAADWWDPRGSSAMLHRLNPARLRYIRQRIDDHWRGDTTVLKPLAGKRALDVGCGGGLLAEPLARLGAEVTGLDAAAPTIAVARAHAERQGLAIDYRIGGIESLTTSPPPFVSSEVETRPSTALRTYGNCARPSDRFDLITSLEVVEHAADPDAFVRGLAAALAPDGLLILSTPNRTPFSKLAVVTLGESLGGIPRGTHDWSKFLTPAELGALVEAAGLRVDDVTGLSFDPRRGFVTSPNVAIDYLLTASRAT
ncbi:MAG: bifunctional 2-polyprenyl-6-hydroxyphenol methylase/3-demethylubiquinol 3-O-methyltransferase UbiG [Sphingomonadaceae bacterium]|nr:bifunctional 2-polyprenyl-6-hydroxyphenol methylase/3-demethylubiquinol 3-O-methyltransferase UbiG [Sphingomonadaceae bacterium]